MKSDEDTTLEGVLGLLPPGPVGPINSPIEAQAIGAYFGVVVTQPLAPQTQNGKSVE